MLRQAGFTGRIEATLEQRLGRRADEATFATEQHHGTALREHVGDLRPLVGYRTEVLLERRHKLARFRGPERSLHSLTLISTRR